MAIVGYANLRFPGQSDEAGVFSKIRLVDDQNGLEASRILVKTFEPKARGRRRYTLSNLLHPTPPKNMADAIKTIERWEKDVADDEKMFKKNRRGD